jgi:hypothetical protein
MAPGFRPERISTAATPFSAATGLAAIFSSPTTSAGPETVNFT